MPDKVTVFLTLRFSRARDKESQASCLWVSGVMFFHRFCDGTSVSFTQIMNGVPVDDHGEFAAGDIRIVSIAVVINPSTCDGINVLKYVIFRRLRETGRLLNFGNHIPNRFFWGIQM